MIYNRLHRIIAGGVAGIVAGSAAGAWFLASGTSVFLAFVCLCLVVALAVMLVRRMEKTGRQLGSFFSAIHNNDFNVHYTEKEGDAFLNGLFREMNRIMAQFEDNQARLEERRLYYESIIRVLTHEIRNSITPIASLSADLISYTDEYGKEGMVDGLQTIHRQAQQLNTFLNAYHRLTHLPDPVQARTSVRDLFGKLERLLSSEPGSKYVRYASPEDMEILLDAHLITLALINLIRNALQAAAGRPDPQAVIEAGQEGASPFIQVIDNGEGIPPERLEDIFIPFYSTRKEGSGIGLPLSRRIMQLHGGELLVDAKPGKETVFRMTFPALPGKDTVRF